MTIDAVLEARLKEHETDGVLLDELTLEERQSALALRDFGEVNLREDKDGRWIVYRNKVNSLTAFLNFLTLGSLPSTHKK